MTEKLNRLEILAKVNSGEITAKEGVELLAGLENETPAHKKDKTSSPDSAMGILEKIESGEISPDEGVFKFQAGSEHADIGTTGEKTTYEGQTSSDEEFERPSLEDINNDPAVKRWRSFWQIPTWIGLGLIIISSLWLYNSYDNGQTFWFILSWIPFLTGMLITYIGWSSKDSTWVHVRVKTDNEHEKVNISISFPIPLQLGGWFLRSFGHFIPQLNNQSTDLLIAALDKKNLKAPLFVDVNDNENEKVQIIIG